MVAIYTKPYWITFSMSKRNKKTMHAILNQGFFYIGEKFVHASISFAVSFWARRPLLHVFAGAPVVFCQGKRPYALRKVSRRLMMYRTVTMKEKAALALQLPVLHPFAAMQQAEIKQSKAKTPFRMTCIKPHGRLAQSEPCRPNTKTMKRINVASQLKIRPNAAKPSSPR